MKSILLTLATILFTNVLCSDEKIDKIYVNPSQISIVDQGIFVYIAGDWVPVESIGIDANGIYAKQQLPPRRWICKKPGCYFNNNSWDDFCQRPLPPDYRKVCGAPRPQQ